MNSNLNELTLYELSEMEDMSIRCINICKFAGLFTLEQILTFYANDRTLLNVRNCGVKTEIELKNIFNKYSYLIHENQFELRENKILNFDNLGPKKKKVLNNYIDYYFLNLSKKAQKEIQSILNFQQKKSIAEVILISGSGFNNKRLNTFNEISAFKIEIFKFYNLLLETENESIYSAFFKQLLSQNNDSTKAFDLKNIFDPKGKVKLFTFLKLYFENSKILNKNEKKVFDLQILNLSPKSFTNRSLSKLLNITPERIRQIIIKLNNQLQIYLHFITYFSLKNLIDYGVKYSDLYIMINNEFTEKINKSENVYFNKIFYTKIFGLVLNNTHKSITNDSFLNKNKSNQKFFLKNSYFIEKNIFSVFDFKKFCTDLNSKQKLWYKEDCFINFNEYLGQFLQQVNLNNFESIEHVCKKIIWNEFGLVITNDGYLILKRNTLKLRHEYIIDILEAKGTKMSTTEVFNELKKLFPNIRITKQSVIGTIISHYDQFVYLGRTGFYGLKKWDMEQKSLKPGTIRDFAEEFLKKEKEPKHVLEILSYVQKYRKTSRKSLSRNLLLEEKGRFKFLGFDFFGLNDKAHFLANKSFKKIKEAHFLKSELLKLNGLSIDQVIENYVNKYGYSTNQVTYMLNDKIKGTKKIQVTNDNNLYIT